MLFPDASFLVSLSSALINIISISPCESFPAESKEKKEEASLLNAMLCPGLDPETGKGH